MGEVYRATDTALERSVAVKVLADRYARQDEARARFRREALAAARLSATPNVVTVFDVAEHDGRPLIVMEYLEGGSVYERLQSGRVPRALALTWLAQTAEALDRAHASGIVHRDVKPANLLLDRDGNVHVSDFGIASASGADMLTAPGTVLGTAGYLSPEQARGEPATPASDRYALGVVAFELLTGRRPFAGDTPTTEAFAHLNASIPRAVDVDPRLPPALDTVFESALAKDPVARPATARELVAGLRGALDTKPVPVSAPAPTRVMRRSDSEHRPDPPTRRLDRREHRLRQPRARLVVLAALALLALGLASVAIVTTGDDFGPPAGTAREAGTSTQPPAEATTTQSSPDGAALNRDGFARMQVGDYAAALPLLRGAVLAVKGSNTLDEAYASYNLAFSRFAVGRCDGVAGLLGRSERIQGHRSEIDELRGQWQARCAPGSGDESDDGGATGKHGDNEGNGKGKARGHDRD
jgi:eukaryotic-like serine/threonine-protein kinase